MTGARMGLRDSRWKFCVSQFTHVFGNKLDFLLFLGVFLSEIDPSMGAFFSLLLKNRFSFVNVAHLGARTAATALG